MRAPRGQPRGEERMIAQELQATDNGSAAPGPGLTSDACDLKFKNEKRNEKRKGGRARGKGGKATFTSKKREEMRCEKEDRGAENRLYLTIPFLRPLPPSMDLVLFSLSQILLNILSIFLHHPHRVPCVHKK